MRSSCTWLYQFFASRLLVPTSCTYYFWDLVGIPCRHVVATINYKIEYLENMHSISYSP